MIIKIRVDSMVIASPTDEQTADIEKHGTLCEMVFISNDLHIKGRKEELFDLLFNLSRKYDIEVV